MNEKLIKELIRFKLDAASTIIAHMPPEVSKEIRSAGRVILEGLNESLQVMKEQGSGEAKPSGGINNIPVE